MGDWEAGWEEELGMGKRDRKVKVGKGKVKGGAGGRLGGGMGGRVGDMETGPES